MDDIHSLSEEDIKLRYITPAILAKGWSVQDITMETKVKIKYEFSYEQDIYPLR